MIEFHEFLVAILRSGTPIVYAALAGVIVQRSGIWHLGLEGVMIIGACATVVGIVTTNSFTAAILIAIGICVLASVLQWFVIEKLKANQIIAGLGITGIGIGGTAFAIETMYGSLAAVSAPFGVPRIGAFFGPYGSLSIFVLMMPFAVAAMWLLLLRSRFGLRLAAAGEHPFAARSVGAEPAVMRLIAFCIAGVLCAIAGAELAAGSLQIFAQNMVAGRGFMGFAAVLFGAGHPVGSALAAMFFSLVSVLGIRMQISFGAFVSHDLLLCLPYVATVLGVWITARARGGASAVAQASELRDP